MADWYVYQHDGDPLGPWSTDTVAEAILAGKLAPDVWVAAPGGPRWLRALDVPVIGRLVEGIPTKPRRDSGLRLMPQAFRSDGLGAFGSTMMIVKDNELELAEEAAIEAPTTSKAPVTARMEPGIPDETAADETLKVHVPTRAIETRADALAFAAEDDDSTTDPALPPSSSSPVPPPYGDDAVALPRAPIAAIDRRRRRSAG